MAGKKTRGREGPSGRKEDPGGREAVKEGVGERHLAFGGKSGRPSLEPLAIGRALEASTRPRAPRPPLSPPWPPPPRRTCSQLVHLRCALTSNLLSTCALTLCAYSCCALTSNLLSGCALTLCAYVVRLRCALTLVVRLRPTCFRVVRLRSRLRYDNLLCLALYP